MTVELLEPDRNAIPGIADKEYLGRGIIVGRTADERYDVVAYFPTGRSPGSRARFLDLNENTGTVDIVPSAEAEFGQGNPALIYYSALDLLDDGGIVVTNGAQTDHIFRTHQRLRDQGKNPTPLDLLVESFERGPVMMDNFYQDKQASGQKHPVFDRLDLTSFEPDTPNYTPRISAVLGKDQAAMCIALCNQGNVERHYFNVPLIAGTGRLISTYTGQNVPSGEVIPHFEGSPVEIPLNPSGPGELAHAVYVSLGPKQGDEVVSPEADLRVGVVAAYRSREHGELFFDKKNKYERGE